MPETFQSLAVLVLALLPGSLYVWAFERQAGAWGIRLADRLFRFVGFSAVLHALIAPITYWLWVRFVRAGALGSGKAPVGLWLVPLVYVGAPALLGTWVGLGTRERRPWTRAFTGPNPAPRAWDNLFGTRPGRLDPFTSEERGLAWRCVRDDARRIALIRRWVPRGAGLVSR